METRCTRNPVSRLIIQQPAIQYLRDPRCGNKHRSTSTTHGMPNSCISQDVRSHPNHDELDVIRQSQPRVLPIPVPSSQKTHNTVVLVQAILSLNVPVASFGPLPQGLQLVVAAAVVVAVASFSNNDSQETPHNTLPLTSKFHLLLVKPPFLPLTVFVIHADPSPIYVRIPLHQKSLLSHIRSALFLATNKKRPVSYTTLWRV